MKRTYIKDGKHKSIKNLKFYKELKQKLDFTPSLHLNEGKREILKECYKDFLEKYNLDIVGKKIVVIE